MNKRIDTWKLALLSLAFAGPFVFFFSGPVMTQQQVYHSFVDTRTMLGIPNALDVLTNVAFIIIGLIGIREVLNQKNLVTKNSWFWLFISVALIGPGSAWYHWTPNNETLVWDRLPMSMCFMVLYIILLSEHLDLKIQKFLYPAILIGLASIAVWVTTGDLRFYFWIQFSIFITTPIVLLLFPSQFSHKHFYFYSLLLYAIAKLTEFFDKEIFSGTQKLMSGHSLKHLLAAAGLLCLWWMLKVRREVIQRS